MEVNREYQALLKEGSLKQMDSSFTGDWKKDRVKFTRLWEMNQEVFNDLDVDFEELL